MDIDFIALDLETANFKRSSICEIGLAFVKNGEVVGIKSWLVQPPHNSYSNYFITIHGISPEETINSPSFPEVWKEIKPLLTGNVVVSHNTAFDMYALKEAFDFFDIEYPEFEYYCSLRISRMVFPGLRTYSLPYVCKALSIDFGKHHRAGGDAKGCAEIFLKTLEKMGVEKIDEIDEILRVYKGCFNCQEHFPFALGGYLYADEITDPIDEIVSKIEKDNYFVGKGVCFTGDFKFINRKNLLQLMEDIGGCPHTNVTKKTHILVVGQQKLNVVGESGLSSKHKKALALLEKGQDIEIMSEAEFLSALGL